MCVCECTSVCECVRAGEVAVGVTVCACVCVCASVEGGYEGVYVCAEGANAACCRRGWKGRSQ